MTIDPAGPPRTTGFDSELAIIGNTATTWRLLAPLVWTGTKGDTFTVPIGFVTDFASVPRFLHWLVSPYGAYTRAAVLHDWLLRLLDWWQQIVDRKDRGQSVLLTDVPVDVRPYLFNLFASAPEGSHDFSSVFLPAPPANSRDCDGIFRRVMQDLGVPAPKRWVMWAAVRSAALFNPRRAYGRRFLADLPAVLGVFVLAAPIILPGAIGTLVSLTIARPFAGAKRTRA